MYRNYIYLPAKQCDQIGRIFAYWATVFFWQILENYISTSNYWAIFSTGQFVYLFRQKTGWALGDFFTNSYGHPAAKVVLTLFTAIIN
jgi:hypothetical protein